MLQNFIHLASKMPVDGLLQEVSSQPELWDQITARQDVPGTPHHSTKSIFLRWCPTQTVAAVFTEIETVDYPAYEHLPAARKIVDQIFSMVSGSELGRALIVNLAPGGAISPHPDEGLYADHYERFHLSLRSETGNLFFCGEPDRHYEACHMKEGELWWFNHKETHWVVNNSKRPRVHLIVDIVAPAYRRERRDISA